MLVGYRSCVSVLMIKYVQFRLHLRRRRGHTCRGCGFDATSRAPEKPRTFESHLHIKSHPHTRQVHNIVAIVSTLASSFSPHRVSWLS